MKINRNGVDIELTRFELRDAYEEYQRICDREDIMSISDFYEDDASFEEAYGITSDVLESIVEDCAVRYRKYRDDSDYWFDNATDAIRTVVIERKLCKSVEG